MGSFFYHSDVRQATEAVGTTRTSDRAFDYHTQAAAGRVNKVHPDLDILGKVRECCDSAEHPLSTPIAVLMDVTKSRGEDAKRIYAQVPSLMGSLIASNIVTDPEIMWGAVGDANNDKAPIQIGQFESDRRMDAQLAKIWMEEGGGGTGEESYELGAYALLKKTKLDCLKRGKKGYAFFLGDEAPYPTVSKKFIKEYIGDTVKSDLPTEKVFAELMSMYNVFLIFPRATMQQRRVAIDSEIKQRLDRLGGQYKDVSIRVSLMWDNRNDLDLHCLTPRKEHIYFRNKIASCGGALDVDRNAQGEDLKPVENIRWPRGQAPEGQYLFWVENFRYWERAQVDVPFRVEIDCDGELSTFEGKIPAGKMHTAGKVEVASFVYKGPNGSTRGADIAADYSDEVVLAKWGRYIPSANILRVQNPETAVEAMIGALAIGSGKMDLEQFVADMKKRRVSAERSADARSALSHFATSGVFTEVADLFG